MHEVLVNCLGGLSLPGKSVVRLTDRPDMTLDVYRGRKTTMQQQGQFPTIHKIRMIIVGSHIWRWGWKIERNIQPNLNGWNTFGTMYVKMFETVVVRANEC